MANANFKVKHGVDVSNGNSVRLFELLTNGTNSVSIKSPDSVTTDRTWILPQDDPTTAAGKYITTDASGVWSFNTLTPTPAGSDTQVQFNDGGAFGADADLTWNKTTNVLTINGNATSLEPTTSTHVATKNYADTIAMAMAIVFG